MLSKEHSEYECKSKEFAMLEYQSREMLASLPSPRVLNTHHTPSILPEAFLNRKGKIIHVMRNPKDICVSLYHHVLAMQTIVGVDKTFTFASHLQRFISGQGYICDYYWFIKEFEKFKKDNPEYPILDIYYEDMQMRPVEEIRKLAKFLGKNISDDLASKIADKCYFDNLKQANEEVKDDYSKNFTEDGISAMYRKGKIGDWKTHFTVADNELFDRWIAEGSKDLDIKFVYE